MYNLILAKKLKNLNNCISSAICINCQLRTKNKIKIVHLEKKNSLLKTFIEKIIRSLQIINSRIQKFAYNHLLFHLQDIISNFSFYFLQIAVIMLNFILLLYTKCILLR